MSGSLLFISYVSVLKMHLFQNEIKIKTNKPRNKRYPLYCLKKLNFLI
jgi:hypothetical protein